MEKCGKTPEAKRREHSQGRELRLLAWSAWTASASATAASFKNWKSQSRPSTLNHNRQLIRAKKTKHTHTQRQRHTHTHKQSKNRTLTPWRQIERRSRDVELHGRRSPAILRHRPSPALHRSPERATKVIGDWSRVQRGFKLGPNNGNLTLGPSPEFHNLFRAFKSTKACNSKHSCK